MELVVLGGWEGLVLNCIVSIIYNLIEFLYWAEELWVFNGKRRFIELFKFVF